MIGATELVLLATNVTTGVMLYRECADDLTCSFSRDTATALKTVNLVSGGLTIATYLIGVFDGFHVYRCLESFEQAPRLDLAPTGDGMTLTFSVGL